MMTGVITSSLPAPEVDPLFATYGPARADAACEELVELARLIPAGQSPRPSVIYPHVGERLLDIFARASNPEDPMELCQLFLGRVETESSGPPLWPHLAERWSASRRRRSVEEADILRGAATPRFVKELFNFYFRNALYGRLRDEQTLIMSSGAADEAIFGLPAPLRACVVHALDQGWYGYSDSRGRVPTREAVAQYETARSPYSTYTADNVSISMGGTFAMNSIADFVLHHRPDGESLCLAPNYPPLVEAVARRTRVRLVPAASGGGRTDLTPLIEALATDTPLVMLQTVTNPTGCAVDERQLEQLIGAASPSTVIVIDEAHECCAPEIVRSPARSAPNVVRLVSLSKALRIPGMKVGWVVAAPDFVSDYYEYASTSFGGPPSLFALLIEVAARFERWLLEGVPEPTPEHVHEFEPHCGLTLANLGRAYRDYRHERDRQEKAIGASRRWFEHALTGAGFDPVTPQYSSNICARPPSAGNSYLDFRRIFSSCGVSVYPGVLNFLLDEPGVRFTTAQRPGKLVEVQRRLCRITEGAS